MGPKKKMTREEILLKKRVRERERYQRMKQDPQLQEEEKERVKYAQKKKKKQVKLVKDMTARELRKKRKQCRVNSIKYYKRKTNPTSISPPNSPPESPLEGNDQQNIVQGSYRNDQENIV